MRIVSAPVVVPMVPGGAPWLAEGAVALDDDDTVRAVGPRAELRRRFARHPRATRARARSCPGSSTRIRTSSFGALAGDVPGGEGLPPWAAAYVRAGQEHTHEQRRDAAANAAADAVGFGTAAVGDVGNSLAVAAGHRRRRPARHLLPRAARLARRAHGRRARRRRPRARARRQGHAVARRPRLRPRAARALLRRPRPPASHLRRRGAHGPADLHPRRRGSPTSSRSCATARAAGAPSSRRWASTSPTRVPGQEPVAYLASLGAFAGPAPPLLVHMVHASANDRRLARDAGATVVLCPRSNLHIGGRLPDVRRAARRRPHARARHRQPRVDARPLAASARSRRSRAHFPEVPALVWLEAATRGGARALRLEPCGALAPGRRPGLIDVAVGDLAAPLEALVRTPAPPVCWMAHA